MKKITQIILVFIVLFVSSSIHAQMNSNDDFFTVSSTGGTTASVLDNDYNSGVLVLPAMVNVNIFVTLPAFFNFNPTTGQIVVAPGTPFGVYTFTYLICETSSPNNCDNSVVTINVSNLDLGVVGTYIDFNANSFVDAGDTINYTYTVTNNGITTMTSITVTGLGLSGASLTTLGSGLSDSTITGFHILTETDINNGFVINNASATGYDSAVWHNITTATTTSLAVSDGFQLLAFDDSNLNGVLDSGESLINVGTFDYKINSGPTHSITSSSGTTIIFEGNPLNMYDFNYTIDPSFTAFATTATTFTFSAVPSGITPVYFPIQLLPYNDLSVRIDLNHGPVPGFWYGNWITIENNGTTPITGETLTYNCDPRLTIIGFVPSVFGSPLTVPSSFSSNSFSYTISTAIPPGGFIQFFVQLQTPILGSGLPPFALGDLIINTAMISPPAGDITPLNNNYSVIQDVRGSYDPNDISENHGEKILFSSFTSSDYLTYTIRFENTGTGNAINIKVDDVLDTKLDPTTVRMIGASAPFTLDRLGNSLSWKFSGINLPPSVSSSSPVGKGYITFQVKPNAGFAIGDIIPNTANIYFDFNPAIVTNTFLTEFVSTLATNQFDSSAFEIYPNPTSNILNIKSQLNIFSTEITDINGRTIQSSTQNNNEVMLNIENIQTGMYLLKVTTEKGTSTQKIIKK